MKEILLYGTIGWEVDPLDIVRQFQAAGGEDVLLRIHSDGGSVHDGNAIISAIRGHDGVVSAQIDGMAFSMAAVIALEVRERLAMPADAWIMFHEVSGGGGEVSDLKRQIAMMEAMNSSIVARLAGAMGKEAEEVAVMLAEEIWLTGAQAHAAGIVATLIPAQSLAARARPGRWKNPPETLISNLDYSHQQTKHSRNEAFQLAFCR